jgi:hypothetical protein
VRERLSLGRRIDQLEGSYGTERKCRCRVWVEDLGKPWAQSIVLAHPGGDDSETCGDCGGQRVVVVVNPGFPLDECGCPECVRRGAS